MTIQIGTLSYGHAEDFLSSVEQAIQMLDTLAQIQACAGTQGMQHRSGKTENVRATLENYMRMLRRQEQQEERRR